MTTQTTTAPVDWTEIRSHADDSYAPHALIGWVAQDAEGDWFAVYPDLNDITHDPQPPKHSVPAQSAEAAEGRVRGYYARWVARQS